MANTAAHLVDRVLPAVPVRQWVLSLPFDLRSLAAFDAKVLRALVQQFVSAIEARYRAWTKRVGVAGGEDARGGAITFVQRFGSSLNLNVHLHVVALDGVCVRGADGHLLFHASPASEREELAAVLRRVHQRAIAWLSRHGHVRSTATEGADGDEPNARRTPLEACASMATQRGTTRALALDESSDVEEEAGPQDAGRSSKRGEDAVEHEGFNLHAHVRIATEEDLGRERLCRYGARPPFSLERLRKLPDGRIAYRIKSVGRDRAKYRVMTPLELLVRLAALVPPPRCPLVRYHGVLAPHSRWRREIVPRPPAAPTMSVPCAAPGRSHVQAAGVRQTRRRHPGPNGGTANPANVLVISFRNCSASLRRRSTGDHARWPESWPIWPALENAWLLTYVGVSTDCTISRSMLGKPNLRTSANRVRRCETAVNPGERREARASEPCGIVEVSRVKPGRLRQTQPFTRAIERST